MFPETPSIGLIRQQTGFTRRSWLARAGQGFGLVPLLALERSRIRGRTLPRLVECLVKQVRGRPGPGTHRGGPKVLFFFLWRVGQATSISLIESLCLTNWPGKRCRTALCGQYLPWAKEILLCWGKNANGQDMENRVCGYPIGSQILPPVPTTWR